MTRAPSICSTPGCFNLAPDGGKCPECKAEYAKRGRLRRNSPTENGYDGRWRRTAGRFLKYNPWCSEPGCSERATCVDHIDGLGPLGPNGHKWANLRGFCSSHHSKRTARDQPGGFRG